MTSPRATASSSTTASSRHATLNQSYAERSERDSLPPLATYLLRLMHLKRTNLCVSADVKTSAELLQVADEVGDHICVLKTHADIVTDFSEKTAKRLGDIAKRKKFLIFEDRKFSDIGNTVQEQYTGGFCSIVQWAHLVNAQVFAGPSIVTALSEAARKAVAAHNTSVQTDISASPAPSVVDSGNDNESDNEIVESDEGGDGDSEETESRARSLDDDDDDDDDEDDRSKEFEERLPRKHSVVSVSTTISTKTETLSPQPRLRPSLSRGSTEEEEADSSEAEDLEAELEELGPPPYQRSLLLLAQMSSKDNLFTPDYTQACVAQAREHRDFVVGFIAQQSLNREPSDNFITMTPGVQLSAGGDGLGQQYDTPRNVLAERGSDVIIVGRGILAAKDRRRAALDYRKHGWSAYEERLHARRRR